MKELEKMLSGEIYNCKDKELVKMRNKSLSLCFKLNNTLNIKERKKIIKQLFPNADKTAYFQSPIQVDYGKFVTIGKNFYSNYNLVMIDNCPIKIGNNVMIGPNVSLVTAIHPMHYKDRDFF